MLTRLQIDGFKNLRQVDLRFGPFTCIAGRNGVGKSNLFDAISFLSGLASQPLVDAAVNVRGTGGRISGIESLFAPDANGLRRMRIVADMIVPRQATDDYDREVSARATYLRYTLNLAYDGATDLHSGKDPLYIEKEELVGLPASSAEKELGFGPSKEWLGRYVKGPGSRNTPFIATEEGVIKLFADNAPGEKKGGRPQQVPTTRSPKSVLSGINAATHPTALAARREMQSWRLLQLEPSALRSPDEYRDDARLSQIGQHLPNTLLRIGRESEIAQQLSELIPGIVSVNVDSDDVRQQRTLKVVMRDRRTYAASSLSDGTLRFLALGVLAADPRATGLMCLEEPENGIHPQRLPEMMRLVKSLAEPVDDDDAQEGEAASEVANLRQVIINTHSPLVVAELDEADLLLAETLKDRRSEWVNFKPMLKTWRDGGLQPSDAITPGEVLTYLDGMRRIKKAHREVDAHPRVIDQISLFDPD
jgi:predicted ATPase